MKFGESTLLPKHKEAAHRQIPRLLGFEYVLFYFNGFIVI